MEPDIKGKEEADNNLEDELSHWLRERKLENLEKEVRSRGVKTINDLKLLKEQDFGTSSVSSS